jgi:hypothetical protein
VVRAGSSLVTNTTPGKFKFEAAALILAMVRPEDGHDPQAAGTELLA